jgi:hypothetical protein
MFFGIPDPTFFHPRSRICIEELKYFNPKKWFLSSRKYDPGCSIRIPDPDFLPIPDPGVKKGTGTRIRIRNTETFIAAYVYTCIKGNLTGKLAIYFFVFLV